MDGRKQEETRGARRGDGGRGGVGALRGDGGRLLMRRNADAFLHAGIMAQVQAHYEQERHGGNAPGA